MWVFWIAQGMFQVYDPIIQGCSASVSSYIGRRQIHSVKRAKMVPRIRFLGCNWRKMPKIEKRFLVLSLDTNLSTTKKLNAKKRIN